MLNTKIQDNIVPIALVIALIVSAYFILKKSAPHIETEVSESEFITTASGLKYKILKEGTGSYPKATDTVTVHYRGTLMDGTEFDSSYNRGNAISFPLTQVIPGWTEGLQLVRTGGQIRLKIPPNLGYGDRSAGKIPPNSTLLFDVELIGIK